ncbi:hypothetical protein [Melittangium boletus]|uniref:Outer membrane protein beta-barrel domain-containing protein n=1 Tax=Melittangium boletus DSM 14713 TaxID=1294270 RepID=A0A250IFY7_9BACT|nr:hypothetical protein [Melittangium boletus]ATB30130.1 hypothetical protein MEBOL_003585 [Melittangium boletus DSM 14713]
MRMWMKWSVCAGLSCLPMTARAEAPPEARRTVLLVQPLFMGMGQVGAGVEQAVGGHVALSASVQGTFIANTFRLAAGAPGISTVRYGVSVDPGVHFYLAGRAPEGLWVGPHLEASWERMSGHYRIVTPDGGLPVDSGMGSLQYGGSARVGYTAILSPGLSAQVGLGLSALRGRTTIVNASADGTGTVEQTTERGWSLAPRLTVGVGWAF